MEGAFDHPCQTAGTASGVADAGGGADDESVVEPPSATWWQTLNFPSRVPDPFPCCSNST